MSRSGESQLEPCRRAFVQCRPRESATRTARVVGLPLGQWPWAQFQFRLASEELDRHRAPSRRAEHLAVIATAVRRDSQVERLTHSPGTFSAFDRAA
jgi:hypothetical protein